MSGRWPDVPIADWPAPVDAFPVDVPFRVRPDLQKLDPEDDWLWVDRDWGGMLAAKRDSLLDALSARPAGRPARVDRIGNVAVASAADGALERRRVAAIRRAAGKLAATPAGRRLGLAADARGLTLGAAGLRIEADAAADGRPRWQALRADAAALLAELSPALTDLAPSLQWLGALALTLQEDLVLMETRPGPGAGPSAAVLQVAFPSAWDPAAKVGQDLFGLHTPVADNQALQAAAQRLGAALVAKGPFVRWVWTVTTDDRWRAWPPRSASQPLPATQPAQPAQPAQAALSLDALTFRLERQTTMPLGEGFGLFMIRVQVRPLADVLAVDAARAARLRDALRSMSDAVIGYKNLGGLRERVDAVLAGFGR